MAHLGLVGFRARNPTKMMRGVFRHVQTCRKCIPVTYGEDLFFRSKFGILVKIWSGDGPDMFRHVGNAFLWHMVKKLFGQKSDFG